MHIIYINVSYRNLNCLSASFQRFTFTSESCLDIFQILDIWKSSFNKTLFIDSKAYLPHPYLLLKINTCFVTHYFCLSISTTGLLYVKTQQSDTVWNLSNTRKSLKAAPNLSYIFKYWNMVTSGALTCIQFSNYLVSGHTKVWDLF